MDKLKNIIPSRVPDKEQALQTGNQNEQPPSYFAEDSSSSNVTPPQADSANANYGTIPLPPASVMSKAVLLTELKHQSLITHCPYCKMFIYTRIKYEMGMLTIILWSIMFMFTIPVFHEYGFILLLLLPATLEMAHSCPSCKKKLAKYSFITGISVDAPVATMESNCVV
jgi:acyl-CoA synthetase (AMP-forming)/AMP-acid ligase II